MTARARWWAATMDGHPCAAIRLTHALLVPAGETRSEQLGALIAGMVEATGVTGRIGMVTDRAECLPAFRAFNDERVSCLPGSTAQARPSSGYSARWSDTSSSRGKMCARRPWTSSAGTSRTCPPASSSIRRPGARA